MQKLSATDRVACAAFGAVSGAIYGIVLAIIVGFLVTGRFSGIYVWCTASVFAAIGFIAGPGVGDVIAGALHAVYGFCAGILSGAAGATIDPEPEASGQMRSLFLFGLGTGIAVFIAWYLSQ